MVRSIEWYGEAVRIIDQTELPESLVYRDLRTVQEVREAIRSLRIRGAPAIGIAGAMGVSLGLGGRRYSSETELLHELEDITDYLAAARPTAFNLFWALDRVKEKARDAQGSGAERILSAVRAEGEAILEEEREMSRNMGRNTLPFIRDGAVVLTHCNTGCLATAGTGTALAGIYAAKEAGRRVRVYASETRPLLQGARLTAWELMQEGVDVTLITDSMAAHVMREKGVDMVIVGADRIARNGDTANKIGTYQHALTAKAHGVPFYVVAPLSTIDTDTAGGLDIPIEEREGSEIVELAGKRIAPRGVKAYNPAFDVTPAALITAIITDRGAVEGPDEEKLMAHCGKIARKH